MQDAICWRAVVLRFGIMNMLKLKSFVNGQQESLIIYIFYMPKNKVKATSKKRNSNKATGRKYTAADLRSNRKNQAKRVELNRAARQMGVYGKRWKKGKDLSHGADGSLKLEKRKSNRSRNGQGKRKRLR